MLKRRPLERELNHVYCGKTTASALASREKGCLVVGRGRKRESTKRQTTCQCQCSAMLANRKRRDHVMQCPLEDSNEQEKRAAKRKRRKKREKENAHFALCVCRQSLLFDKPSVEKARCICMDRGLRADVVPEARQPLTPGQDAMEKILVRQEQRLPSSLACRLQALEVQSTPMHPKEDASAGVSMMLVRPAGAKATFEQSFQTRRVHCQRAWVSAAFDQSQWKVLLWRVAIQPE
ncbi:uncharacterized protein J3D65DRAFT_35519 [Phyllosticta citribraziliensis]|uniref:Uncharacterized protein n=1 Tax=Phyllosticta citribraziliensis TaxID=989973 RepID=A0ABR1MA84_9PEZI